MSYTNLKKKLKKKKATRRKIFTTLIPEISSIKYASMDSRFRLALDCSNFRYQKQDSALGKQSRILLSIWRQQLLQKQ